jgi:integrase
MSSRKRSATPGYVEQRGPKTFRIKVYLGTDERGKPKYKSETFHGTRRDAERRRVELVARAGRPRKSATGTVRDLWLAYESAKWSSWSPGTAKEQTTHAKRLEPLLDLQVNKLTSEAITKQYRTLGRRLAPGSVRRSHAALAACLAWAERKELLPVNPMRRVDSPHVPRQSVKAAKKEDVSKFLDWCLTYDLRYHAFYRMAYLTGMRRGEMVALRWDDFEPIPGCEDRQLTIVRTMVKNPEKGFDVAKAFTKNGDVRRIVVDAATWDALQACATGSPWVFATEPGRPWPLDRPSRMFSRLQKQSGITVGQLKSLRHGHATSALNSGFNVKQVAERLGHKNVLTTLTFYTAAIPAVDVELARSLALAL